MCVSQLLFDSLLTGDRVPNKIQHNFPNPPLKKKEQSVGRNKHWPSCVYKNGETKKKKTKRKKQLRNAIVQKFSSRSLAHARTHEILFH